LIINAKGRKKEFLPRFCDNIPRPSREKQTEKDKLLPPTEITTIDEMIEWANNQEWTEDEIAHFDSLNENYSLLI